MTYVGLYVPARGLETTTSSSAYAQKRLVRTVLEILTSRQRVMGRSYKIEGSYQCIPSGGPFVD